MILVEAEARKDWDSKVQWQELADRAVRGRRARHKALDGCE